MRKSYIPIGLVLVLALVAATTGVLFIVVEAVRRRIRLAWIAVVGTFLIGFSFGLPFFLFLRQIQLDRETRGTVSVDVRE
jgi:hypothetical protein